MDNLSPPIDEQLKQAYLSSLYRVSDPAFDIRIGITHEPLDQWLATRGYSCWAFVTAWNPKSSLLSIEENEARHQALMVEVASLGYSWQEGWGIGQDGSWAPEKSILVPGIMLKEAISIARQFGQLAIVFGEAGNAAQLIWV